MIANFTHGDNFHGAVDYVHRSDKETAARIISYDGVCIVTNQSISDSFNLQAQMRPNTADPVRHISISFHPDDAPRFPDNEDGDRFMAQLALEWMHEMKIENTQYLIVRHHDHEHPHCHLVFNLVDNDGNVIDMSNDLKRNVDVCKRIKRRYGLTFGKSDGKRINADRLRGYAKHRHEILMGARAALETATSWHDFIHRLKADGIKLNVAIAKGGVIQGVSYSKGDFRITGAKLDRQLFTYNHLAARFGAIENVAHEDASQRYSNEYRASRYTPEFCDGDWYRFGEQFPRPISLAQMPTAFCRDENAVGGSYDYDKIDELIPQTDSTDANGTTHIDLADVFQVLALAYDSYIPSYAGTDTSLDAYRKRDREQKRNSRTFKRR